VKAILKLIGGEKKENSKAVRYDLFFAYSLIHPTTYIGVLCTIWGDFSSY
jgi:hypothetical protein